MKKKHIFIYGLFTVLCIISFLSGCINENQSPHASFSFSPPFVLKNTICYCNSTSTDPDGTIVNYTWYINDEPIGYTKNITYNFNENGTYVIKLVITDDKDALDSSMKNIIVGNSNALKSKFLGTWHWSGNNQTGTWIFYQNNTLKATFKGFSASITNWWLYQINGSEICFSEPDNPRLSSGCYGFEFDTDDQILTISSEGNVAQWYRES